MTGANLGSKLWRLLYGGLFLLINSVPLVKFIKRKADRNYGAGNKLHMGNILISKCKKTNQKVNFRSLIYNDEYLATYLQGFSPRVLRYGPT